MGENFRYGGVETMFEPTTENTNLWSKQYTTSSEARVRVSVGIVNGMMRCVETV